MTNESKDIQRRFKLFDSAREQRDWATALAEFRIIFEWLRSKEFDDRFLAVYRQILTGLEQKVSEERAGFLKRFFISTLRIIRAKFFWRT